jgi:chemotaxis regulatin CheY-phosphate phosphatase CheZ
MFTRSQAKLMRENKEQRQRQQEQEQEQRQQQQNEKSFVVIDRIKQYINDTENIDCSDCCLFRCNRIQNKIRKIDELYEYMLSDEIKQDFFVSLFASYSKFILSVFTKTKELKDELVKVIKVEKIQEHLKEQKELMKKLNKMKKYLEENMTAPPAAPPAAPAAAPAAPPAAPAHLRRSARLMAKRVQ